MVDSLLYQKCPQALAARPCREIKRNNFSPCVACVQLEHNDEDVHRICVHAPTYKLRMVLVGLHIMMFLGAVSSTSVNN